MFDDPRWGDDPRDRDDDTRDREERNHRDDDTGPHLGRGRSSRGEKSETDPRDRDDERWPERDRDPRDLDPRDVFMRDLDLPRGRDREIVHDPREREYTLRGSETRTLSTVGAFRVVPARDLRDHSGREADPRSGDLRHLREQGLISTVRLDGRRDVVVVLTDRGRDLLVSQHRSYVNAPVRQQLTRWRRCSDGAAFCAAPDSGSGCDGRGTVA